MKFDLHSRRAHVVVALVAVALLAAINNGPLFWNRQTPGDLVDGRFNMFVLEHVYQWLIGRVGSLGSPPIFYPFPDMLFFSDGHFGSALVYAFFRAIGQSEYFAYDSWFLIGYVATFAAAYYAIARLGGGALMSALGAAVFAFSLPSIAQFGHPQLVYRCGVPLALLFLWLGIRDGSARSLMLAFVWLCFQSLLSIYLGVFLFILMAVFAISAPLVETGLKPPREWLAAVLDAPRRLLRRELPLTDGFVVILALAVLIGIATLAMFAGYAHATHEYKLRREWSEIVQLLPRPVSYLLMAPLPYWAPVSAALAARVPMAHEHNLFLGLGALGFVVVGLIAVLRNLRSAVGAMPARAMTATLLVTILITIAFGKHLTLYRSLASLPGLNAIRAVTRIGIVLAYPAALIGAVGLRALVTESKARIVGVSVAALLACLAAYEFITITRVTVPIDESERRVDTVVEAAQARAQESASPILLAVNPAKDDLGVQLDAMLAAQRMGWPTINGYSGNLPPGASLFPTCALAGRQFGGYEWWRARRRPHDPAADLVSLMQRVVFVGADCDDDPLNRRIVPPAQHEEPASEALPAAVTLTPGPFRRAGSLILFTVTIKNDSADQWIPGRSSSPVSLSWRFAPPDGRPIEEGWDPREPLPTDVAPGAAFAMSATASVPDEPGDYRLEVSLVADGRFWFHDKGMQPLRFEQTVTVP
jgi:hypothetical protein